MNVHVNVSRHHGPRESLGKRAGARAGGRARDRGSVQRRISIRRSGTRRIRLRLRPPMPMPMPMPMPTPTPMPTPIPMPPPIPMPMPGARRTCRNHTSYRGPWPLLSSSSLLRLCVKAVLHAFASSQKRNLLCGGAKRRQLRRTMPMPEKRRSIYSDRSFLLPPRPRPRTLRSHERTTSMLAPVFCPRSGPGAGHHSARTDRAVASGHPRKSGCRGIRGRGPELGGSRGAAPFHQGLLPRGHGRGALRGMGAAASVSRAPGAHGSSLAGDRRLAGRDRGPGAGGPGGAVFRPGVRRPGRSPGRAPGGSGAAFAGSIVLCAG